MSDMTVMLHGAGDIDALGLPLPLLLLLACGAVPALASVLSARAVGMESRPPPRHRPLPELLRRLLDAPVVRAAARIFGLALLFAVVAIAGAGPRNVSANAAPILALVVLWGAVVAASTVLGPFWRTVSPFRALAAFIGRLVDPDEVAVRQLPERIGVWPGFAGLGFWALVATLTPTPDGTLWALVGYTAVQVIAGVWYGQAWFAHGEAVEVLSTTVGGVAPLGRDAEGRIALRKPLAGLTGVEPVPGLLGFLVLLFAWELTHSIQATEDWPVWIDALGLSRGTAATGLTLLVACAISWLLLRAATPRSFLVVAAIPLVTGWTLAHHVGPFVVEWRAAAADLADPFGRDWSLYELAGPPIEPSAPGLVALVQLVLLVVGALAAVLLAHRAAVARYDLRAARAVQFPFRLVAIVVVAGGILLQAHAAA